MQRCCLWFEAPYQVSVRDEALPDLASQQVLVQTEVSAISAGTELLFYRDQIPPDLATDSTIAALAGQAHYPLRYGYACVGRVIDVGSQIDRAWRDRLVFSFQPHASRFVASLDEIIPVPREVPAEHAAFLPSMETAVNFLMDGAPLIGERVLVLGQGVVGLLTTALLARLPLAQLVTCDRFATRRELSCALGANESKDPDALSSKKLLPDQSENAPGRLPNASGADLVYELTGVPEALDLAIKLTTFSGRVIIGSWYGQKRAPIDLGGSFHRSRIRLISSQVSTLAPELTGRWSKARRLGVAWSMLSHVPVSQLITHRFPIADAAQAYALLDGHPEEALQILFTY